MRHTQVGSFVVVSFTRRELDMLRRHRLIGDEVPDAPVSLTFNADTGQFQAARVTGGRVITYDAKDVLGVVMEALKYLKREMPGGFFHARREEEMRRYHGNPGRRGRRRYPEIGSVSWGTLVPADLVQAFSGALEDALEVTGTKVTGGIRALLKEADAVDDDTDPDEVDGILEELTQELEVLAPPFCYFGSIEGDPTDFGFWVNYDALDDAIRDGEVLVQDDSHRGRNDDIPKGFSGYVLHTSDHGNRSLYRYSRGRQVEEVW